MADSDIPVTAGSGTKVDTRTVGAGTDEHRQVIVVGDPTTAANVAAVMATAPVGTEHGVVVRQASAIPAGSNAIGKIDNNIMVSAVNASTANLAAAATFTGTSEATTKSYAIQVTLRADQPCTIFVDQGQDGTNWDQIDSWTMAASATDSTAGRTVQAVGAYYRVRVTNTGASTTTTFRLQSVLSAVGEALPRALTQSGSLRTVVVDPTTAANVGKVTPSGELYVTDTNRVKSGVGIAHSGRFTVTVGADGATAGRLWLLNLVGSAVLIEVRRVEFTSMPTAATVFVTAPRVTVERMTFTGTPSGATITPVVRDTNDTALVGTLRTASTGITPVAGAIAYGFSVANIMTAVGSNVPTLQEWEPAENGRVVLRAGQGIVIRQADAGTASDTRVFQVNLGWAEYTVLA